VSTSETIEEYFWAAVVMQAAMTANDSQKNILKQKLGTECKQYVTVKLGEMLGKPTSHIYNGTSAQLLAETVTKARAIRQAW